MSDSPFILAIDLGTSGPKVALVSGEGEVIAADFERVEQIFLPGGGAEQRPEDWWTAIVTATRRLLAGGRVGAADIAAICCTSLYSTTVPVGEDGRPLANAIMWMDTRGAPYVRRLVGGVPSVEGYGLGKLIPWLRLTGGVPTRSGKDSLAHILYLKHEHPEIYRRARFFLEPKDYLNLRMCGRAAATYDSINLHWLTDNRDIHHIRYHERLLQMADVDGEKLPPLVSGLEVLGTLRPEAAEELGLRPEVRVVAGVTDAQSAAIGAGAIENYVTYLYLGTSSWISCHVPFKKTDLLHNMASLPSALPGRYYVANEQECAGVCLDFLRESVLGMDLPSAEAYRALDRAAEEAPPGSGGVIFTPWLYGERTPIEDPNVRGGFFNLSLNTTRSELIRAVFEGVAYNARWLLECVERFVRRRLEPIRMIGGGAQSDLWCQIHADVLGRVIHQVKEPIRANLRGAALLAAAALGHLRLEEAAARVEITRVFHPNPENHRRYEDLFRAFLELYRRNKSLYHRLNRSTALSGVTP